MFKAIRRAVRNQLRRRRLNQIRRAFAACGYPIHHLDDSRLEAALTGGACRFEDAPLSAKTIYFALRRLFPDGGGHFR